MENKLSNLLCQVGTLVRKNNEILDATGSRFNIFSILGVNHYENTHSAILAEFLSTKGSHTLGPAFLEAFVNMVNFDDFDVNGAHVITELYGGDNGRMDIVIESFGKAIIIENKIYAGDQWEQLKRYKKFADCRYPKGYKILYLTLYGDDASENSGHGVDYTSISYCSMIIKWLEECVKISSNYPMVRETLNQYINHIKKLTNQDMNTKQNAEIIDIMHTNAEASLRIADNIIALKRKLIIDCAYKLAEGLKVLESKCSQGAIYIVYKGYYLLFGDDGNEENGGKIYASVRTKELVIDGTKNSIEPKTNNIFSSYTGKEWNPYGYSYLSFSFYNSSTLIDLMNDESPKYRELKEWLEKMKLLVDEIAVTTK